MKANKTTFDGFVRSPHKLKGDGEYNVKYIHSRGAFSFTNIEMSFAIDLKPVGNEVT